MILREIPLNRGDIVQIQPNNGPSVRKSEQYAAHFPDAWAAAQLFGLTHLKNSLFGVNIILEWGSPPCRWGHLHLGEGYHLVVVTPTAGGVTWYRVITTND